MGLRLDYEGTPRTHPDRQYCPHNGYDIWIGWCELCSDERRKERTLAEATRANDLKEREIRLLEQQQDVNLEPHYVAPRKVTPPVQKPNKTTINTVNEKVNRREHS
jgi:hypothetical protein